MKSRKSLGVRARVGVTVGVRVRVIAEYSMRSYPPALGSVVLGDRVLLGVPVSGRRVHEQSEVGHVVGTQLHVVPGGNNDKRLGGTEEEGGWAGHVCCYAI